jgi:hypothetical protein
MKKMNINKKVMPLLVVLFLQTGAAGAQSAQDTSVLIKEFNRIMGFTAQPYVHYTALTRLSATPVMDPRDSSSFVAEFYKANNDFYSNSSVEELYMEDSLMVQVNKERKTIWVSRVDVDSKDKLSKMPFSTKDALEQVQKNYTITKSVKAENKARLVFETRRGESSTAATKTTITLEYDERSLLPSQLDIDIVLTQPVDEEMNAAFAEDGTDKSKLVKVIGGVEYLVRNQRMSTLFTMIGNDKVKALTKPSYKSVLLYDEVNRQFAAQAGYKEYEVTQTF